MTHVLGYLRTHVRSVCDLPDNICRVQACLQPRLQDGSTSGKYCRNRMYHARYHCSQSMLIFQDCN
jgi:hypothetical protein